VFEQGALVREQAFPTGAGLPQKVSEFFAGGMERAVVASVVPALTPLWGDFLLSRCGIVHVAGHDSPWGFEVGVEEPVKVGVDRLANMEGVLSFPGSVLVVDAGTATKFDLLEGVGKRRFVGGAIAPGIEVSYRAMLDKAAQLAPIDLAKHSPVVGYNTETAIRSGVVHGFAALVDGMVLKIFEEKKLPAGTSVVLTGGNASYLDGRAQLVSHRRPHLTLEGLHGLARKI
jgi:type III pantothenate kinase